MIYIYVKNNLVVGVSTHEAPESTKLKKKKMLLIVKFKFNYS